MHRYKIATSNEQEAPFLNPPRSIAIINPLGDFGINAYSYELAEGLYTIGVQTDVYTNGASPLTELPETRRHGCFPVLGSLLLKQALRPGRRLATSAAAFRQASASSHSRPGPVQVQRGEWHIRTRKKLLQLELAGHLKSKGYDWVWTQWPDIYGTGFWRLCRRFGLKTIHTVHNVLPHEESAEDKTTLRNVYGQAHCLVTHSEFARRELVSHFPEVSSKTIVAPHGTYTIYPRRPDARERLRGELRIEPGQLACLVCGAIRPYKNVDSSLLALSDPRCLSAVLVVAGKEAGFADSQPLDPLAHTRGLAQQNQLDSRVRLIPRFLSRLEMADLFEAADVVLLPYVKGYGSGLLLLAMTFRKYIVTTDTGGAGEYLRNYPQHTLIRDGSASEIASGISEASRVLSGASFGSTSSLEELQWSTIARKSLDAITALA